jgi:DNA polymerase III alpha subunit
MFLTFILMAFSSCVVSNFLQTRSFLAQNIEVILETLVALKSKSQNSSDDLFGNFQELDARVVPWSKPKIQISKKEVLLKEKDSLGLYVSGNPLEDYRKILEFVKEKTLRDDVFLVLVDKIKKIFTRNNSMMFSVQLSVLDYLLEGVIFPKNALKLSPIIQEKKLFWVKGKIQNNRNKNQEESAEDSKEYENLPKLIIEEACSFESGPLPLFEGESIALSQNRQNLINSISWVEILEDPTLFTYQDTNSDLPKTQHHNSQTLRSLRLSKNLGLTKLNQIKASLKDTYELGYHAVALEVETSEGFKKVKGTKYLPTTILQELTD